MVSPFSRIHSCPCIACGELYSQMHAVEHVNGALRRPAASLHATTHAAFEVGECANAGTCVHWLLELGVDPLGPPRRGSTPLRSGANARCMQHAQRPAATTAATTMRALRSRAYLPRPAPAAHACPPSLLGCASVTVPPSAITAYFSVAARLTPAFQLAAAHALSPWRVATPSNPEQQQRHLAAVWRASGSAAHSISQNSVH